ncbi:MAG: rod shape-determining protein RodA [Candidatus Magasanikbacteria bacterium]|nr:rod shape-determining protein RodA [Candidatus Magasanikbacteria bacterium]
MRRLFWERIRRLDWVLLVTALALAGIGLVTIYSVDLSRGIERSFFNTQAVSLLLGVSVALAAAHIHLSRYEKSARFLFLVALLLLIGVLFFGTTIRGTRGWYRLAGFSFQPVEIAKVVLIIFLAWRIERAGRQFAQTKFLWATGIMSALLVLPVLLQPDFGSGAVMLAVWLGLVLVAGLKPKTIAILATVGMLTVAFSWIFLFKDYQRERILNFANPDRDPLGTGYNVNQSLIAIGSGQFFGRGLGSGSQSQLHFLPEAQTDFILAVVGEELGFVGLALLLGLYGVVFSRLIRIARLAPSDFGAYTAAGVVILLSVQLTVNAGAAMGLLPVTGVTLPFVSYGGTSLISNFLLIGIAESVAAQTRAV